MAYWLAQRSAGCEFESHPGRTQWCLRFHKKLEIRTDACVFRQLLFTFVSSSPYLYFLLLLHRVLISPFALVVTPIDHTRLYIGHFNIDLCIWEKVKQSIYRRMLIAVISASTFYDKNRRKVKHALYSIISHKNPHKFDCKVKTGQTIFFILHVPSAPDIVYFPIATYQCYLLLF